MVQELLRLVGLFFHSLQWLMDEVEVAESFRKKLAM